MTRHATAVQLPRSTPPEKVAFSVADSVDIGEGEPVDRLSLDVRASDAAFLERFAEYRNELAKAQGKKLKRKWSRKSLMESLLAIQCDALRKQLGPVFERFGDLPDAKKKEEMERYAKRVAAYLELEPSKE